MSSSKQVGNRQRILNARAKPEPLDRKPIEIPLNARAPGRGIEDEIQRQIAIQLAKKK